MNENSFNQEQINDPSLKRNGKIISAAAIIIFIANILMKMLYLIQIVDFANFDFDLLNFCLVLFNVTIGLIPIVLLLILSLKTYSPTITKIFQIVVLLFCVFSVIITICSTFVISDFVTSVSVKHKIITMLESILLTISDSTIYIFLYWLIMKIKSVPKNCKT